MSENPTGWFGNRLRSVRSMDLFAWADTPAVDEPIRKRTRRLMLAASIFCLAGAFYSMSIPTWVALALGLAVSPFLTEGQRTIVRRYSDPALWPSLLFAVYALARLSPDAARSFAILTGLLLVQTNWRMKSDQDAMAFMAPFCCMAAFGFVSSESLFTSLAAIVATLCLLMGLSCANDGVQPQKTWRHAWRIGKVVVMAIPWIVALFFLFPRIPFNTLPQQQDEQSSGSTGLSDSMAPGSISDLVQSNTPAFTAKFSNRVPEKSQLYWRATVFDRFDGSRWMSTMGNAVSLGAPRQSDEAENRPFALTKYEVSFAAEPMRFLPVPDGTAGNRIAMMLKSGNSVSLSPNPFGVYQTPARGISSGLISGTMKVDATGVMDANMRIPTALFLQLPEGQNPRTQAFAKKAAEDAGQKPEAIVAAFHRHIGKENYWYTLKPPLLGTNGVDQFLFETQRGFCEHYSSAFVVFMRMAGVPARVVTGYQGGELDPIRKTATVISRDAHAWAEILSDGKWVRVDPTSFIDPSRVEPEAANLGSSWALFGEWGKDVQAWAARLSMKWNEKVVAYDADTQEGILDKIGVPSRMKHMFTLGVLGAIGGLFFLIAIARQAMVKRTRTSADQRRFEALRKGLAQQGFVLATHHTGLQIQEMVQDRISQKTIDERLGRAFLREIAAHNRRRYERR